MSMENLLWVPADLPVYSNKQHLIDISKGRLTPNLYAAKAFDAYYLTTKTDNYQETDYSKEIQESCQDLIEYLKTYLPFDKLAMIKIHNQQRLGTTHIDFANPGENLKLYNHNRETEPCGYRMVIAGQRHGPLYVKRSYNTEKIYVTLPETTDWYILGHTTALHGLDNINPERYTLFCHAWIKKEMHDEILKRSLEKYGEYAVWKD